jgi:uncharacterized membrane protein YjjP (DUF1212 family)
MLDIILFYFVPMIIVFLWLYYFIYINDNVTVTNGAVMIAVIVSLIPGVNIIGAITTIVIWLIESDWANTPFKKPW